MLDPDTNLILRWLRMLPNHQRVALAAQYSRRLAVDDVSPPVANRHDDPGRALGNLLFVDCADSLGLSPTELRGLIASPQRHVMRCIAWLSLEQIRNMRVEYQDSKAGRNDEVCNACWRELPPGIAHRMNDLFFWCDRYWA